MAEKISTLVLKVDLECCKCYKKIKKVLCQLQDCMKIWTISYDKKNNKVTLCGPFDPEKLSRKLRCKACKVILDIQVVEKPPTDSGAKKKAEEEAKKKAEEEAKKKAEAEAKKKAEEEAKKKAEVEAKKKAEEEAKKKAEAEAKKKAEAEAKRKAEEEARRKAEEEAKRRVCCCRPCPCYHGSYGGHRCCSCGMVYVFGGGPPMVCGKPHYDSFTTYYCEEQPSSCAFM